MDPFTPRFQVNTAIAFDTSFTPSPSGSQSSYDTTTTHKSLDFYHHDPSFSSFNILSPNSGSINDRSRQHPCNRNPQLPRCSNGEASQVAVSRSSSASCSSLSSSGSLPQHHAALLPAGKVAEYLEMGTGPAFLVLYNHGILSVSPFNGFHAFECPNCGRIVNSSISDAIGLTTGGHFTALVNHYRRKLCLAVRASREQQEASQILVDWNRTSYSLARDDSPTIAVPNK